MRRGEVVRQKSRTAWLFSLTLGGTGGEEAIATSESNRARDSQASGAARCLTVASERLQHVGDPGVLEPQELCILENRNEEIPIPQRCRSRYGPFRCGQSRRRLAGDRASVRACYSAIDARGRASAHDDL